MVQGLAGSDDQMLIGFDGEGIIRFVSSSSKQGEFSREYTDVMTGDLREIEAYLRRMQQLNSKAARNNNHANFSQRKNGQKGKPIVESVGKNVLGELGIAETVYSAVCRMAEEKRTVFQISGEDIKHYIRRKNKAREMCLIIDASSSMAGKRLDAAKALAHQLLLTTSDRISVVVFFL